MTALTFGSLFSGIGGIDLGLERAGWRCAWQVELDSFRRGVLARHWPDVRRHDDVATYHDPELVDLVCGGFPCQPVSFAGRRRGDDDARWLWPQMRRVCALVRPRWVLAENVRGLLSAQSGRLFGRVVRELAALGYLVEWSCISAAAVGAPHIRDRVWILAHRQETGGLRIPVRPGRTRQAARDSAGNGSELADAGGAEFPRWACLGPDAQQELAAFAGARRLGQWQADPADDPESGVGRVADGIPHRVHRIAALGDSVVPQVAEFIGRRILEHAP